MEADSWHAEVVQTQVELKDVSGGCGSSFDLLRIVSPQFAGQRALQRHRLINGALKVRAVPCTEADTPGA